VNLEAKNASDLATGDIIEWDNVLQVVIRVGQPNNNGIVDVLIASYWEGETRTVSASAWAAFTVYDGAVPPPDSVDAIYVKRGRGADGLMVSGPATRISGKWVVRDQPLGTRVALDESDIAEWEYATVVPNSLLRAIDEALSEHDAPLISKIRHRMVKEGRL
jgi:hypothetical protein